MSRIIKSWGYVWNGDGHGCGTCYSSVKNHPKAKKATPVKDLPEQPTEDLFEK